MFKIFIFLSLFLGAVSVKAEPLSLTDFEVSQKFDKNWKGILFICDPYCRFLAIKEHDKWNPVLDGNVIGELSQLKGVSTQDPIYPLLVRASPVFPYVSPEIRDEILKKKKEDPIVNAPPTYAKAPFGLAYSFGLGPRLTDLKNDSDSRLQSELSPKSFFGGLTFQLDIMRGTPQYLLGLWLHHHFSYRMDLGSSFTYGDGQSGNFSGDDLRYQMWMVYPHFKVGPRFTLSNQSIQLDQNDIAHYSVSQSSNLVGLGFLWQRWAFGFDVLASGKTNDFQYYRQGPFKHSLLKIDAGYCSRTFKLFDISFGYCAGAEMIKSSQSSKFVDEISVRTDSQIDQDTTNIRVLLRFGEDFFR